MASGKYDLDAAGELMGRVGSPQPPASEEEKREGAVVLLDDLQELASVRGFTVQRLGPERISIGHAHGDVVTVAYTPTGFEWTAQGWHSPLGGGIPARVLLTFERGVWCGPKEQDGLVAVLGPITKLGYLTD